MLALGMGKTNHSNTIVKKVTHMRKIVKSCNPCSLEGPQRLKAGDKIKSGPRVGGLAT